MPPRRCGGDHLEARALSVRALAGLDQMSRIRMHRDAEGDRSWRVNRAILNLQSIAKPPGPLGANGGESIGWTELSRNGRADHSGIGGSFLRNQIDPEGAHGTA